MIPVMMVLNERKQIRSHGLEDHADMHTVGTLMLEGIYQPDYILGCVVVC